MQTKKLLLPMLCMLLVLLLSIGAIVYFSTQSNPGFQKPDFDASAQTGPPTVEDETLGYQTLDADRYVFAMCAIPKVDDHRLQLYFTNVESNSYWLKIRVQDESGTILGESGLLKPGEYVQWVQLSEELQGEEKIALRVMGYEPETYMSAGSVQVSVAVQ